MRRSEYFKKHKRALRCPFCGLKMDFTYFYAYDSKASSWVCFECGCSLPDKPDYSEEELKVARMKLKRMIKEEIEKYEDCLQELRRRLQMWGKHMSEKEKVKLLAETLEE